MRIVVACAVIAAAVLLITLTARTSTNTASNATSGPGCNGLAAAGQCYELERADTNEKRMKGLSDRDGLADKTGMLFIFDQPEEVCIWMKEMRFNLDIIWLDESKTITRIEHDVSPGTYPQSFCENNTKYVIELNSGDAAALQLTAGSPLAF